MKNFIVFIAVSVIFVACGSNERKELYDKAVSDIRSVLKSPSTALFAGFSDEDSDSLMISEIEDSTKIVIVKLNVDAQNGYGAMIRNKGMAAFQRDSVTGEWKSVYATLLD
jgi:hypothetical protein